MNKYLTGFLIIISTSATALAASAEHSPPPMDFLGAIFVFILATFIGLDVIRRVSRLLHTPLMSLTNAISAISIVGALLVAGAEAPTFVNVLGLIAVAAATTNIVSGFLITDRMLKMFKKRDPEKNK